MMQPLDDLSAAAPDTVIGPSVTVEGELSSQGDIRVDGHVSGSIKTQQALTIGEQAVIDATIDAESASIAGTVKGNITARDRLELTATAKVTGDITAKTLSVAPGAMFSGTSTMGGTGESSSTSSKNTRNGRTSAPESEEEEEDTVTILPPVPVVAPVERNALTRRASRRR